MIVSNQRLERIIYLDIETAGHAPKFGALPAEWQALYQKKHRNDTVEDWPQHYAEKAALLPEFGQIVCIAVHYFSPKNNEWHTFSLNTVGEKYLLQKFIELLNHFDDFYKKDYYLCGHNIKLFDLPFIAKRMLVHGLPLPEKLRFYNTKPWELTHLLDTLEIWKCGNPYGTASLDTLCHLLGIPTPKNGIDGSQVHARYHAGDLAAITTYCAADTEATKAVFLKLNPLF